MGKIKGIEFKELLVIVHPNWLEHATPSETSNSKVAYLMKQPYSRGKAHETDFKRYRRAMFDVYGRAILNAAKRPDVLVAILAVPMSFSEYKAILRDRAELKKVMHADVARLIAFAKEHLKERLIVINSPGIDGLRGDAERLYNIIIKKKIPLGKGLVIRGGGEISECCVRTVIDYLKLLLKPKQAYVDKSICGDIISNFPKRRTMKHSQRAKPTKRRLKPVHRRK